MSKLVTTMPCVWTAKRDGAEDIEESKPASSTEKTENIFCGLYGTQRVDRGTRGGACPWCHTHCLPEGC